MVAAMRLRRPLKGAVFRSSQTHKANLFRSKTTWKQSSEREVMGMGVYELKSLAVSRSKRQELRIAGE